MKVDDLALVGGWPHTVATLRRWNASPWRLLGAWALGSLAVTLLLLGGTWLVASSRVPDPSVLHIYPGLSRPATTHDFFFVLGRNGTVLALHALACVAGFIAGWVPAGQPRSRLQARAGARRDRVRHRRDDLLADHAGRRARDDALRPRLAARGLAAWSC